MVKVTIPIRGKKLPSYGARVVMRVSNGRLIMQKWPRKRGRVTNLVTKGQNERFRQANMLAKYASGEDQWIAIELTRNSPLYPRDLLMSAMAGRLFEKLTIDGQEWTAVAIRDDISADLDIVAGKVKGTIMLRGGDVWEALVPGTAGDVLNSAGPAATPFWGGVGGGGTSYIVTNSPTPNVDVSSNATKGTAFALARDVNVVGLGTQIEPNITHTYEGRVWSLDATNKIVALEATTGPITFAAAGRQSVFVPTTTTGVLKAGTRYGVCWSRTDGADNFATPIAAALTPRPLAGLPEAFYVFSGVLSHFIYFAKANPVVGDTLPVLTNAAFHTPMRLSI